MDTSQNCARDYGTNWSGRQPKTGTAHTHVKSCVSNISFARETTTRFLMFYMRTNSNREHFELRNKFASTPLGSSRINNMSVQHPLPLENDSKKKQRKKIKTTTLTTTTYTYMIFDVCRSMFAETPQPTMLPKATSILILVHFHYMQLRPLHFLVVSTFSLLWCRTINATTKCMCNLQTLCWTNSHVSIADTWPPAFL